MKFSIVASALTLGLATAAPAADAQHWPGLCLSKPEADAYIQKFIGVFGRTDPNARQTGEKILADDFMEYSNSIRSLQDLPLDPNGNSIAAASKEEWLGGVLNAPQTKGINTIATYVTDCNKIIWFWNFKGVGSSQYPVRGFNLFTTSRKNGQIQTDRLDIEFDSISWGRDSGLKVSNFIPATSPHKE